MNLDFKKLDDPWEEDKNPPTIKYLFLSIFAAVGIHLWLAQLSISWNPNVAEQKAPAEIEVAKWDGKDLPVVQSSRPPEQAENNQRAKFGAENRNRVAKETQSSRRDKFREGKRRESQQEKFDVGEPGNPDDLRMKDLMGANPHHLPDDIEKGSETMLNTDSVRYASFMNRLAEQIYDPWVRLAKEALQDHVHQGKKLESQTYVTKIMVAIDRKGNLVDVKVVKSSGLPELDEAPLRAFRETAPFRNPPSQMFDADGILRFVYNFRFDLDSTAFRVMPFQG